MNNCNENVNVCLCDISLCSLSEAYKVCLLNVKNIELNKIFKLKELKPLYDYSGSIEAISNGIGFKMIDALHIPYCEGLDHKKIFADVKYDSLYEKVSLFNVYL